MLNDLSGNTVAEVQKMYQSKVELSDFVFESVYPAQTFTIITGDKGKIKCWKKYKVTTSGKQKEMLLWYHHAIGMVFKD